MVVTEVNFHPTKRESFHPSSNWFFWPTFSWGIFVKVSGRCVEVVFRLVTGGGWKDTKLHREFSVIGKEYIYINKPIICINVWTTYGLNMNYCTYDYISLGGWGAGEPGTFMCTFIYIYIYTSDFSPSFWFAFDQNETHTKQKQSPTTAMP